MYSTDLDPVKFPRPQQIPNPTARVRIGRHKNTLVYRGMTVAAGTVFHEALTEAATNPTKAEKLYKQLIADFTKHFSAEDQDKFFPLAKNYERELKREIQIMTSSLGGLDA